MTDWWKSKTRPVTTKKNLGQLGLQAWKRVASSASHPGVSPQPDFCQQLSRSGWRASKASTSFNVLPRFHPQILQNQATCVHSRWVLCQRQTSYRWWCMQRLYNSAMQAFLRASLSRRLIAPTHTFVQSCPKAMTTEQHPGLYHFHAHIGLWGLNFQDLNLFKK